MDYSSRANVLPAWKDQNDTIYTDDNSTTPGKTGGAASPRRVLSPWKRALDLVIAVPTLIFVAPLLIALAVMIRMHDAGPALFRQSRIGFDGRTFVCFKFRTMVMDAEGALRRHLEKDPRAAAEWAATQKLRRDPRITPVGRFLRRTSLDELPQLFNILRGEMSVVGPRPIVENEVPKYGDLFDYYIGVRPGVTGLWQVSGRNDVPYPERVRMDADYVKDWSIWLDLRILLLTIPAVLFSRGAY